MSGEQEERGIEAGGQVANITTSETTGPLGSLVHVVSSRRRTHKRRGRYRRSVGIAKTGESGRQGPQKKRSLRNL